MKIKYLKLILFEGAILFLLSCTTTQNYKLRILNSTNYFLHGIAIYNSDNISSIDIAPSDTSIILNFSNTEDNYSRIHGGGCITMSIDMAFSLNDTINNLFRTSQCIKIDLFSKSITNIISVNKLDTSNLDFEYSINN
jgi:hypothetical protein